MTAEVDPRFWIRPLAWSCRRTTSESVGAAVDPLEGSATLEHVGIASTPRGSRRVGLLASGTFPKYAQPWREQLRQMTSVTSGIVVRPLARPGDNVNGPTSQGEPDWGGRSLQAGATTALEDVRSLGVDVDEHGNQWRRRDLRGTTALRLIEALRDHQHGKLLSDTEISRRIQNIVHAHRSCSRSTELGWVRTLRRPGGWLMVWICICPTSPPRPSRNRLKRSRSWLAVRRGERDRAMSHL